MFWVVVLVLGVVALALLIEPFLRQRKVADALEEEDYLAAQIADIARDREAGLISAEEAEAADKEARRRLLAEHRTSKKPAPKSAGKLAHYATIALAALAPLGAFLLYGALGNPSQSETRAGQELAARARAEMAANMTPEDRTVMIQGMVEGLAARLDQNPDDLEGWTMLARSYGVLGENEKSADAFARAVALSPDDINLHAGRVQALMSALGNAPIDQKAEEAVAALAALDSEHPFALYFQGLAASQQGDTESARDFWSRLVEKMPKSAPERDRIEALIEAL